MKTNEDSPSLYEELAEWWPILPSPEEYAEEAQFHQHAIL